MRNESIVLLAVLAVLGDRVLALLGDQPPKDTADRPQLDRRRAAPSRPGAGRSGRRPACCRPS